MKITVYSFSLGDVEDPQLYAAFPLSEWQKSEKGKWVMSSAVQTPEWFTRPDVNSYGFQVRVVADLKEEDVTYYNLKWGPKSY